MTIIAPDRGRQAIEISNAMTHVHRDQFGRGAGSVKTVISRDFVVTFLEDIYTPMEKTLIDGGNAQVVRDTRLEFQRMMRDRFITIIEETTGRTVRAFLSQNHVGPDIAAEVFMLEPEPEERKSQTS